MGNRLVERPLAPTARLSGSKQETAATPIRHLGSSARLDGIHFLRTDPRQIGRAWSPRPLILAHADRRLIEIMSKREHH